MKCRECGGTGYRWHSRLPVTVLCLDCGGHGVLPDEPPAEPDPLELARMAGEGGPHCPEEDA